jgi:hypothetical protein
MTVMLVLAAFGAGCWLGQRDARKKQGRWQRYPQTYDIMKDAK